MLRCSYATAKNFNFANHSNENAIVKLRNQARNLLRKKCLMTAIKVARTMAKEMAMVKNITKEMVMVRSMNAMMMMNMSMVKSKMKKMVVVKIVSKEVAMVEIQLHQIQILLRNSSFTEATTRNAKA